MDYSKQVPATERTLNILEELATEPDGLTAGELMARLEIPRSALFALLNTLKSRDYIEQPDNRGRYVLGTAVLSLSAGKEAGFASLVTAFQSDGALPMFTGTVALSRLDRAHTVILSQRRGAGRVQSVFLPGEHREATAVADGQVLLAGLPPAKVAQQFPAWHKENQQLLQHIRTSGYMQVDSDETVELACPICADGMTPLAAIVLSIPHNKFRVDSLSQQIKQLQQAAARLSYRLGAPVYQPYGWTLGEMGPNQPLTGDQLTRFLQEPWGARLACVRQDGTPHVLPLWYEWDGRFIWLTASPGAHWKAYIRDSQHVSMTVDEPWPPLRRVFVVGTAEFVPDSGIPGGLAALRQRIAVRYLGQGAEKQPQFAEQDGWEAIRIRPSRITGWRGLGAGDAHG